MSSGSHSEAIQEPFRSHSGAIPESFGSPLEAHLKAKGENENETKIIQGMAQNIRK